MTDEQDRRGRAGASEQVDASEKAAHHRDVTLALKMAERMRDNESERTGPNYTELVTLLEAIDARTGRRDPTKRTGKAALSEHATKTSSAVDTARKLNGLSMGSPNWMSLITDLITILNDLHVIPSNQPQTPPNASQSNT
jgi:hypothetical protein